MAAFIMMRCCATETSSMDGRSCVLTLARCLDNAVCYASLRRLKMDCVWNATEDWKNRGQCRLLRVTATSQDGLCLERDGGLENRGQCSLLRVTATSQDGLCLERDRGLENRKWNSDWKDNSSGKANGNRSKEKLEKCIL